MRGPVFVLTLALALAAGLFLSGRSVLAQEFVVGVEEIDYPPFYSIENGRYSGLARDLLDEFARADGLKLTYRTFPVNRLYREFLNGALDFKFPDNLHWKGELKKGKKVFYSRPAIKFIDGVVVREDNLGKGLAHLKVLGVTMGFTPWSYLDLIKNGQLELVENPSFGGLLRQTIEGRVDGAYMNPVVARYQLAKMNQVSKVRFDPQLPYLEDSYRLSSLKHPDIIERFNRFLEQEAETVKRITTKHGVKY